MRGAVNEILLEQNPLGPYMPRPKPVNKKNYTLKLAFFSTSLRNVKKIQTLALKPSESPKTLEP